MDTDAPEPGKDHPRTPDPRRKPTPSERRVQVAAARLRVTLDRRLGRTTPPDTEALAREQL